MVEMKFGHIIARGTADDIAMVKKAIDECVNLPKPLGNCIARDYVIEVHSSAEFLAAIPPAVVPGTKLPAQGHVMPNGMLWINRKIVRDKPSRARHIVRHEVAHVIPLTPLKKQDLCVLMDREDGTHPDPANWKGYGYRGRPSECFADTFAVAASGKGSPWDDFAYWKLDVAEANFAQLVAIALRTDPAPPDPEIPEDPLPPVSPELELCLAKGADLQKKLDEANAALIAANARIAAKDIKAQELIGI